MFYYLAEYFQSFFFPSHYLTKKGVSKTKHSLSHSGWIDTSHMILIYPLKSEHELQQLIDIYCTISTVNI